MRIAAGIVAISCTAALALSWVPPAGADGTDEYAAARQAFQEAYAHVATEKPDAAQHDSPLLKGYSLYPYLEAARIRQALGTVTGSTVPRSDTVVHADKRAGDFLIANPQTPVARALRRFWLDSLAHRGEWNQFLEAYHDAGNDPAIRCESFAARINLSKGVGMTGEVMSTWLTPRSLPECDTAFGWLKDNGLLTAELIERRVRLALESGSAAFARQILPQLPAERAAPLSQWAQLLETPARAIDAIIASDKPAAEPAALLAGWTRLGRIDPDGAKSRFAALVKARGLNHETASPYALALALALAWNRDPDALTYFEQVQPKDLDDNAQEWRVRAALWSGNWDLTQKSLASLSPAARQSARWRYWAGRAAEQQGDTTRAQELYTAVLADDNYYSAMAAARLNKPVIPHPQPIPVQPQVLARLEHMSGMDRARELFKCGMRGEALAEWTQAYESLSEDARQQAILLAKGWGWYDQAVTVAATQHIFNDYELLYPTPYQAEVQAAAQAAQVSPEMVYGVLRQESLYRVDAVSGAGARGLMQLQLSTAKRAAITSRLSLSKIEDLFIPSINTILGAARLRQLLDLFGGQTPLALAGYNAGSNAVRRWMPARPVDPDIWIENIPYNETRGYVQRVLWHSLMFNWLRHQEAQQTRSWLEPIRPTQAVEDRMADTSSPRT
jgi:soluble lytic murein transglycosylase